MIGACVALLALAAQVRTVQVDTGPRACLEHDLWPDRLRGRFAFRVPALPADAHHVEVCMSQEGGFTLVYVNRGSTPLYFTGGTSVRLDLYLGDGSTLWWFGTAHTYFQVPASNPLMPGEKREEPFAFSEPLCLGQPAWQWQEKVKTGLFCSLAPIVCTLNGVELCCDDPNAHPDLDVYVRPPSGPNLNPGDAWARLRGEVTFN